MTLPQIKTSHWFAALPSDHARIGISRGTPRRMAAGYRIFRKLAPGPWFNSVSTEEYIRLYHTEILAPLDPHAVAKHLIELADGKVPVMVCFERAGGAQWCHRSLVAAWLAEALGLLVPEYGFEDLPQSEHPLRPPVSATLV
jgi:hypothetical protein